LPILKKDVNVIGQRLDGLEKAVKEMIQLQKIHNLQEIQTREFLHQVLANQMLSQTSHESTVPTAPLSTTILPSSSCPSPLISGASLTPLLSSPSWPSPLAPVTASTTNKPYRFNRDLLTVSGVIEECKRYRDLKRKDPCLGYKKVSEKDYLTEKRTINKRLVFEKEVAYIKNHHQITTDEAIIFLENEFEGLRKHDNKLTIVGYQEVLKQRQKKRLIIQ
jgi:hypothetical protein